MEAPVLSREFLYKLRDAFTDRYPIQVALLENLRPRDVAVLLWVWRIELLPYLRETYLTVFRDIFWDTTWIDPLVSSGVTLTLLGKDLTRLYTRVRDYGKYRELYRDKKAAEVILVATKPATDFPWSKYCVYLLDYRHWGEWVKREAGRAKARTPRLGRSWQLMNAAYDDVSVRTRTYGFCDFPYLGVSLKARQIPELLRKTYTRSGVRYSTNFLSWGDGREPKRVVEVERRRRQSLSWMATPDDEEDHKPSLIVRYDRGRMLSRRRNILILIPEEGG